MNYRISKTKFITYTALLLALCLGVQQLKSLSQFITGPLVNTILLIATLYVSLPSGLLIAVLSPLLAFLIAPSPIMQVVPLMIPIIMLGNATLILPAWLLRKKSLIIGLLLGSLVKAGLLWAGIAFVIIPFFGNALKPPQKTALAAMFSYNQLITALIGSLIAYLILLRLKKN